MTDPVDLRGLIDQIAHDLGAAPSIDKLKPGRFIRFSTNGKPHDDAGVVKLFEDGRGAYYKCHRQQIEATWQARDESDSTPEERERIREQQRLREQQEAARHEAAAEQAALIDRRAPPATAHPYLNAKHVASYALKVQFGHASEMRGQFWTTNKHGEREQLSGLLLLIGMRNAEGHLVGFQAIDQHGRKAFQKGARAAGAAHWIGRDRLSGASEAVGLVEGYATGASVFAHIGEPIAIAFCASNLKAVAKIIRTKLPRALITIFGDDDVTGRRAAEAAAKAVGGTVSIPPFSSEQIAAGASDWNDYYCATAAGWP